MRQTTVILAGLVSAGLWAATAAAQPGPPPAMRSRPILDDAGMRAIGALLHADGLSDDQHEELHSVLDSDRSSVEPLLDQLRMANETFLDQLLAADAPSTDTLSASVDRISGLRRQLLQQQVQTVMSLRDVLAPEQLQQAAQRSAQLNDDVVFLRR